MTQPAAAMERRARVLLRAYPAEYRRERGDEIITTLLETTPPGRSVPLARDAWALLTGGRSARAARNRAASARDNLRLGLLLGISLYLVGFFGVGAAAAMVAPFGLAGWTAPAGAVLFTAAALVPWLGRPVATAVAATPAAALYAYELHGSVHADHIRGLAMPATVLIIMGAAVPLSAGQPRLPRAWLWLPCTPLATLATAAVLARPLNLAAQDYLILVWVALLLFMVACWLVTDTRPAFGLGIAVLLVFVLQIVQLAAQMGSIWVLSLITSEAGLAYLASVVALLAPTGWLFLRRRARPRPLRP